MVTEAGIQIDLSASQKANASDPTRESFEPGSNVNDESRSQQLKLFAPRISTDAGIQIFFNDEHR
jgi:hypothetical protein